MTDDKDDKEHQAVLDEYCELCEPSIRGIREACRILAAFLTTEQLREAVRNLIDAPWPPQ